MTDVVNIKGVGCYDADGIVYLRLEDVARGLGFTQEKYGIEYVRWETVSRYLEEVGFPNKLGKEDFIPENIFYRLCMKARNEFAEAFQRKVADEIIPSIRKTGSYSVHPAENEYLQAAKIVATCPPDRLQIVLTLLRNSGLIPAPQGRVNPTELDRLMTQNEISLRELSRRTGIAISSLSNYRRGLHRPTEERYQLILDTLTI